MKETSTILWPFLLCQVLPHSWLKATLSQWPSNSYTVRTLVTSLSDLIYLFVINSLYSSYTDLPAIFLKAAKSSCLSFPLSRLVFPSGIYIFIWLDPSLNLCSTVTFSVRSLLTTQESCLSLISRTQDPKNRDIWLFYLLLHLWCLQ